jgi:hypothetical protein
LRSSIAGKSAAVRRIAEKKFVFRQSCHPESEIVTELPG